VADYLLTVAKYSGVISAHNGMEINRRLVTLACAAIWDPTDF